MKRLEKLLLTCVVVALTQGAGPMSDKESPGKKAARTETNAPLELEAGVQLFLDDYLVRSVTGLKRIMHPPRRLSDPIITETEQQRRHQPFMTVIHCPEEGRFRMWYSTYTSQGAAHAYAESADGVRWTFPVLGQVELDGSRSNNLLATASIGLDGYPLKVIDNGPNYDNPERRYMMISYTGVKKKKGAGVAFSADGIHWKAGPANPIIPFVWNYGDAWDGYCPFGDIIEAFYDPAKKQYIAPLCINALKGDGWIGRSRTGPRRRLLGLSQSKDFVRWSKPRRILMPPMEKRGKDMTEFYGFTGLYRDGLYIGFLRVLRDDLPADPGGPIEGIGWTELIISRDGEDWRRVPGTFFDRDHAPDSWDHAMAWIGDAVVLENEITLYYGGYNKGHKIGTRKIGLARMPLDRFVSLSATGDKPALLRTKIIRTSCKHLTLNARTASGTIKVRLSDGAGKVLPGYSFADSLPFRGDALAWRVGWKGRSQLPKAARGSGVVLEIEITRGALFALGFK